MSIPIGTAALPTRLRITGERAIWMAIPVIAICYVSKSASGLGICVQFTGINHRKRLFYNTLCSKVAEDSLSGELPRSARRLPPIHQTA